ncbi:MAG: hypothetical protein GVY13_08730 [Alphaproteobacteria bacterium]|nr:hypothetical protein [Alphaproteobacteria bacterium]
MSGGWQAQRNALRRSRRRRLAAALRQVPLAGRLDPALLLLVVLGLGLAAGTGWLAAEAVARLGLFEPPLLRVVPDDRLLANLRDGLEEDPLTAATVHVRESALYLAQQDGRLHRYDLATGLWSTTRPFGPGSGLAGPVTALRAGCGGGAAGSDADDCADPEVLWAMGRAGGLLRRDAGGWRALIPDTAFIGRDGQPVSHAALTTAAVSGDGRRLAVGTRTGDLGLFDIDRQAWTPLPAAAAAMLPEAPIDRLRWWRGQFWIGSAAGLQRLRWEDGILALAPVDGVDGPVRDLDIDGRGGLIVLEDRPCTNGAPGCRRLSRLGEAGETPSRLIDETALFPDLDLAGLVMAGRQAGTVVVMGQAGVHRYDLATHGWRRLDRRPVEIAHRGAADGALFFAAGAEVRRVAGGALDEIAWTLPDGRPVQLADGPDGALLAMSEAGAIHALWPEGAVETVFDPGRTGLDPGGFDRAVASGDRVLLLGSGDALLHDIVRRTYRRIPAHRIAPWLRDPETRLQGSGDHVFGLAGRGDRVEIAAFDLDNAAAAALAPLGEGDGEGLPGPVTAVRDWNGTGLSLIDGDGTAWRIGAEASEALTGPAAPDLELGGLRDVWAGERRLYAATGVDLHIYDLDRRGWEAPLSPRPGLGPIVALAAGAGGPLGRTAGGHLIAVDPHGLHIGGPDGLPMAQAEISDVRRHGDGLFLAGAGRVARYDMAARRVTDRWTLGREGAVQLVAVLDGSPVSLFAERLWIGRRPVPGSGDPVSQAFVHEEHLWTVRRAAGGGGAGGGHRYLMGHPIGAPLSGSPTCLFRQPRTGPEATRIVHAAEIGPDRLAVLTNAGLWVYSETGRTWQRMILAGRPDEDMPARPTDRLWRLGDDLALVRGAPGARAIDLVGIAAIPSPDSCATGPMRVPAAHIGARAVAVDPGSGTLAWLAADGAVRRRQHGEVRTVLPPSTPGPRAGDLRRLFLRPQRLYATTDDAVWAYDRVQRTWTRHALALNGRTLAAADDLVLHADAEGSRETVTATLPDGGAAVGTLDPAPAAGPVALERVEVPDIAPFGAGAAALMDVQQRNGLWMFLLPDRLKALHPDGLVWAPDLIFPGPDESRRLGTIAGHLVVEADEGRTWWIGRPGGFRGFGDSFPAGRVFHHYRLQPEERTLLAGDPAIGVVRLRPDGTRLTCPLGGETLVCAPPAGPDIPSDHDGGPGASAPGEGLPADTGEVLVPGAPLDTSWLDWERETRRFRLRTTAGQVSLAPADLIREGRLIFGVPGRVLADRPDLLHHANPHGVWTFAASALDLDSADMLVRLTDLGEPVAMAHDAVVTATGWLPPGRDAVVPGPAPRRLRLGDAVLEEDIRARRVHGRMTGEGEAEGVPAFAPEGGFAWDIRRGLAFEDGQLVLETAAGRVPTDALRRQPPPTAGTPEAEPGTLVDSPRRRWQRSEAGVAISRRGDPSGLALALALDLDRENGLGFADDRLVSAAAHDGRLMLLTEAALIEAPRAAALSGDTAIRRPPEPAGTRLAALPGPDGVTRLYASGPGETRVWSAEAGRFAPVPAEEDPTRRRLLAETGRLRVSLAEGRIETDLRLIDPETGEARWRPIALEDGRFAFDRVTAVATTPAHVFVGSPAGLQVYARGAGFALGAMVRLTDLPSGPDGVPDPGAARLAVPEGDAGTVRIDLPGRCLATADGAAFRPCPEAVATAPAARGSGPLWRWHRDPEEGPVGRYRDPEGRPFGPPVRLLDGRFPHDRLHDVLACGDRSAAIWQDGRLSLHRGPRLSLRPGMAVFDRGGSRPEALLCRRAPAAGPGSPPGAGLYARFADGSLARLAADGPVPVAPEQAARLDPPTDQRLVFARGRLRLPAAEASASRRFQHRGEDGGWQDLRWSGDRLAIDRPEAIAYGHGRVWLATADGLVALRLQRGTGLRLDPETMRRVALPSAGSCRVSDLRIPEPGTAILRCNGSSDAVFRVSLTEAGGVQRLDADPFAGTVLITPERPGDWQWTLDDRREGRPGNVAITHRGEAVDLARGRFDFDGIVSLAAPDGGGLHAATAAGRWVRAADGDFSLPALHRPQAGNAVAAVSRVTVVRRDGERRLCLSGAGGEAVPVDASGDIGGRLQGCPDDLGSDGLWAYAQSPDGGLEITAAGRAGRSAERRLVAGRFSDGRATGLPVPVGSGEGPAETLVPTAAGVLVFGAEGRPAGLYAPPFPGLAEAAVPRAVAALPGEGPVYPADSGLRALESGRPIACPRLAALAASLPPDATVRELAPAPDGRLRVAWQRPGSHRAAWALAGCATGGPPDLRTIRLDASQWRHFVANREDWGDPPAGLAVSIDPRRVTIRSAGGIIAVDVPGARPLLAVLPAGRTLYLVTPEDIHALALPTALVATFRTAAAPP